MSCFLKLAAVAGWQGKGGWGGREGRRVKRQSRGTAAQRRAEAEVDAKAGEGRRQVGEQGTLRHVCGGGM